MKSSRKIVILISLFTILISLTACGTNDKYGNGRTSKAEYNFDENIASIVVDDVELPDNPKQIMYKYSCLNYAWGCVDYGNIVCADGSVYTYDFSDYEYYELNDAPFLVGHSSFVAHLYSGKEGIYDYSNQKNNVVDMV